MVTSAPLTIYPPTQHTSPICHGIFLIHLPIHHPFLPTLPYISPSFCPQSVHPSASLLTHPSHIHLPIHPSMHSSFPPLLICSFTSFCQLHTAYQSTPLSCLSTYLCFHRPTSHPCTSFPSCHPPLNLSSGPSTHHSSVPPTHLATCLPICLLIDPLPRSVLRWAWHVAECSREDRLKRTWSVPACGELRSVRRGSSKTM